MMEDAMKNILIAFVILGIKKIFLEDNIQTS